MCMQIRYGVISEEKARYRQDGGQEEQAGEGVSRGSAQGQDTEGQDGNDSRQADQGASCHE